MSLRRALNTANGQQNFSIASNTVAGRRQFSQLLNAADSKVLY